MTTLDDRLSQGSRDDNLFHLAHHLVKGDMPLNNIRYFLRFFASHCDPPFSERETEIKIKSALERQKKSYGNLTEEVREWVLSSSGVIFSSECPILSPLSSRNEKKAVSKVLSRLVEDKILERVGDRNGCFRRIDRNLNVIDLYNIKQDEISIKYPLDLQFLIKTQPKNIIIIAGPPNVGKTI